MTQIKETMESFSSSFLFLSPFMNIQIGAKII